MQRLEKILAQKAAPKSARMAKLLQFLQGHPKPAFSEKVQRGDQGKFFKNRPKSRPRFKRLKALWRKWHYPPISMHLKCKDWRRFWRKHRLKTVPEWPSHWDFRKVTQNLLFLKKCKGGTKGNFSKIDQESALVSPKPAFSEKVQMGHQGKFVKNRPKSSPRLKGPKTLCLN